MVEGLTGCPAWPTLRATLILNALDHRDPLQELRGAVSIGELDSAHDPAAVLTWRIAGSWGNGPLPWLPAVPAKLTGTPGWGTYLTDRASLVQECARALADQPPTGRTPEWAMPGQHLSAALISEVEVWRSSVGVDPSDRRATGPVQLGNAARTWQKHLESRFHPNVTSPWAEALATIQPRIHEDPFIIVLTHHLADLHASGACIPDLLARASRGGPLPAEHPAAALWWRMARQLGHGENTGSTTVRTPNDASVAVGGPEADNREEAISRGCGSAASPLDKTVTCDNLNEIDRQPATKERKDPHSQGTAPHLSLIAAREAETRRVHELNRRAEHVRMPPHHGPSR